MSNKVTLFITRELSDKNELIDKTELNPFIVRHIGLQEYFYRMQRLGWCRFGILHSDIGIFIDVYPNLPIYSTSPFVVTMTIMDQTTRQSLLKDIEDYKGPVPSGYFSTCDFSS